MKLTALIAAALAVATAPELATAAIQHPSNATKPVASGLTCQPPLEKLCRGWGRTVFCRCG